MELTRWCVHVATPCQVEPRLLKQLELPSTQLKEIITYSCAWNFTKSTEEMKNRHKPWMDENSLQFAHATAITPRLARYDFKFGMRNYIQMKIKIGKKNWALPTFHILTFKNMHNSAHSLIFLSKCDDKRQLSCVCCAVLLPSLPKFSASGDHWHQILRWTMNCIMHGCGARI